MRRALRPWVHAAVAVLLANGVFLLLAVWAARLPRAPLAAKIDRAFASGELIENDWPWLDGHRGFNQYHDCSVLQMVSNRDSRVWAAALGPRMYNRNRGETDRCATLRTLVTEGPGTTPYLTYRYTRYWHGYIPVTAALLSVLEVHQVRQLLRYTLYGALLALIAAAGVRDRRLLAVAASVGITGIFFWSVRYFGTSLTHGSGDIALVVGLAVLLHWRHQFSRPETLIPFCAVYGALMIYLEFLTALLPTAAGLLVPLVYVIGRLPGGPDAEPRRAGRLALAALLSFGAGAVLTVAVKQILAVLVVGPEAAAVFVQYLARYVNPSPEASLRHFGETWTSPDDPLFLSSLKALHALLTQGYVLTYGSHNAALGLYATSALTWLAGGWLALRGRQRYAVHDLLGFGAGVAIIVAWALAFQTHTTIHKWWMVRMLIVPLAFGWGALAWQLFTRTPVRPQAGRVEPRAVHGFS